MVASNLPRVASNPPMVASNHPKGASNPASDPGPQPKSKRKVAPVLASKLVVDTSGVELTSDDEWVCEERHMINKRLSSRQAYALIQKPGSMQSSQHALSYLMSCCKAFKSAGEDKWCLVFSEGVYHLPLVCTEHFMKIRKFTVDKPNPIIFLAVKRSEIHGMVSKLGAKCGCQKIAELPKFIKLNNWHIGVGRYFRSNVKLMSQIVGTQRDEIEAYPIRINDSIEQEEKESNNDSYLRSQDVQEGKESRDSLSFIQDMKQRLKMMHEEIHQDEKVLMAKRQRLHELEAEMLEAVELHIQVRADDDANHPYEG